MQFNKDPAIFSYQKGMLIAHGNTYRWKSLLKSYGFHWNPAVKYWEKTCSMNTAMSTMESIGGYMHVERFGPMKWMT